MVILISFDHAKCKPCSRCQRIVMERTQTVNKQQTDVVKAIAPSNWSTLEITIFWNFFYNFLSVNMLHDKHIAKFPHFAPSADEYRQPWGFEYFPSILGFRGLTLYIHCRCNVCHIMYTILKGIDFDFEIKKWKHYHYVVTKSIGPRQHT